MLAQQNTGVEISFIYEEAFVFNGIMAFKLYWA
jgi:hypothetical protein